MPIHKKSKRHTKHSRKNKSHKGGACSNLHNINPQASLDLDNKFITYGGPVPLGSNILQGGATCGDEGVGTGNPKSETFKQYLENVSNKFDNVIGGGNPNNLPPAPAQGLNLPKIDPATIHPATISTNNINSTSEQLIDIDPKKTQEAVIPNINKSAGKNGKDNNKKSVSGGGFTTDPSEFIAGQPIIKSYDDCCPPALINGSLKFGSPGKPVCGLGATKGGRRKLHKKTHKHKKHHSKHHSKRNQRGGDWTTINRSKPATYSDAFNGTPGVFKYPDDMMQRTFDETQPNYSVNAI